MSCYYNSNQLCINSDKTELLVISKKILRPWADKVTFYADKYLIKQKSTTKILGFTLSFNLNHDSHINTIISKVNFCIHLVTKIRKFTDFITRKNITTALIISVINYVLPIMINMSSKQIHVLHTLVMKAARATMGFPCYRWSNNRILK